MSANKGKPSGKFAENKKAPGRMGDLKHGGWPEDAPTQRSNSGEIAAPGEGEGRNRKAGSPR